DLRMDRPVAEAEPATGGAAGGGGGGGGGGGRGGGAPSGPLVLPGKYAVAVSVPGLNHELRTDLVVEDDPLLNFSDRDRRTRQMALLTLYNVEKTLGAARSAARLLAAQGETIKRDVGASGSSDATTRADSVIA